METPKMYFWRTRAGTVSIRSVRDRWIAFFDEEDLGSYATAQHACDDLCGGHTFTPSSGVDTATLGLPDDVVEWNRAR